MTTEDEHPPLLGQQSGTAGPRSYLARITGRRVPDPATVGFILALGDALRQAREARKVSRAELVDRLRSSIKVQTVAAYERGRRQLSALRFVEICQAIGVSAPGVLALALRRASAQGGHVDLCSRALGVDVAAILGRVESDRDEARRALMRAQNELQE